MQRTEPRRTALPYRSDVDGLRGLAVGAVVLFHAGLPGFSGGYLGVDVFFVISGYLITGILLKDGTGRWSDIVQFYERRVRRIVPALAVLLICSSVAALALLVSPFELKEFSKAAGLATAFSLNLKLMTQTGYFAAVGRDQPLLHLWSLSVEEQFYLFYPLLLWAVTRWNRKALPAIVLAGIAVSFALSLWLTAKEPTVAFYFTLTRAWELLLGAWVALTAQQWAPSRRTTDGLGLAGLAMLILPVALYSTTTPWPGYHAAVPCCGTALLIALGGRGIASRLLGVMAGIGLISYSLYLWHWPVFIFYERLVLRAVSPPEYAGLIIFSLVAAWVSWRFVERPFRRPGGVLPRKDLFRAAGVVAAVLLAAAFAGYKGRGFPQRLPLAAQYADTQLAERSTQRFRRAFHYDTCLGTDTGRLRYDFAHCYTPAKDRPNVVLWGDSHAVNYGAGLEVLARQNGFHLILTAYGSCVPALNASSSPGCNAFNDAVLRRIDGRIAAVILSGRLFEKRRLVPAEADLARQIAQRGIAVIVLGPSLEYAQPVPLYVERFYQTGDARYLEPAPRLRPDYGATEAAMAGSFAGQKHITYISVHDTVCRGRCPMLANGASAQFDRGHLSLEGSLLYARLLWPRIAAALKLPPAPPAVRQVRQ